jgi:hypothetical protein
MDPVPELKPTDGDSSLMTVYFNNLKFRVPANDPFFLAKKPVTWQWEVIDGVTYPQVIYQLELPMKSIGCKEQVALAISTRNWQS